MADVFLSYSRQDLEIMRKVRDGLLAANLDVWVDEHLKPGTPSWKDQIEHELEAAPCLVVILSPHSKSSKWVNEEISLAERHNKRIFPVLAGDEQKSIPLGLGTIQRVDIRIEPDQEIERLIAAIKDELGDVEPEETEVRRLYKEFWTRLLERSREKTTLFMSVAPRNAHEIRAGAGRAGLMYKYALSRTAVTVDLYIDVKDKAKNKALFDTLLLQKEAIEADFGAPLEWQRLDDDRASRIRKTVGDRRSFLDQEKWPALQDTMIDTLIRLDHALRDPLTSLKV